MKKKLGKLYLFTICSIGFILLCQIETKAEGIQYDKMVIANVENCLNIREKASTKSEVVGQMKRGSVGDILEKGKQWTKIRSGTVEGYVSNSYVLTGKEMETFAKNNIKTKEAIVTTDVLNVREKKSLTAKVLGKVKKGDTLEVKGVSKEWIRVLYKKKDGFVATQYVTVQYRFTTATAVKPKEELSVSGNSITVVGSTNVATNTDENTNASTSVNGNTNSTTNTNGNVGTSTSVTTTETTGNTNYVENTTSSNTSSTEISPSTGTQSSQTGVTNENLRKMITDYGLQFVGNPYVYGGTSLTEGADCSGFVQSVYANFGIKLNRVSIDQATNGKERALSDIQAGDLVFYISSGSSRISHVSIYIGNGKVVHALNREKGICVSDLYYNTPYTVRNVID